MTEITPNKTIERYTGDKKPGNVGEDRKMTILCSLAKKWGMGNWDKVSEHLAFDEMSAEELMLIQDCVAVQLKEQFRLLQDVPLK